jgi:vitamin B12 transporter
MRRLLCFGFLICISFIVMGEHGNATPDTIITLDAVWFEGSRREVLSTGHPSHNIDSQAIQRLSDQHMAYLLSRHSGMFLKSYGPGLLATPTLRGGSASHTALVWNGFSLENPMHQQSDLSLLPVFFMDEVSIQHGGGSALWGSGAMGGTIFMDNRNPATKGWQLMAGMNASSIEALGQQLMIRYGGQQGSSSLKVFNNNARNRYRYVNTALAGNPLEVQQYAALDQWGLLQENYLQIGQRHHLKFHWWYQDNTRNIPPALQGSHSGAFQQDETLRITSEWKAAFNKLVATWRGGYFRENLLYRDSVNLESRSRSNKLVQEGEVRWQVRHNILVFSGINLDMVSAESWEYARTHSQNSLAVFSSFAWEPITSTVKISGSLRQEFIAGMDIPLVPSLGISWMPANTLSIAANAGKNYRTPSLNDRYWVPGGNPELEPESGWSQDLTLNWMPKTILGQEGLLQKFSATIFHRNISNWIIWLPRESSHYWTPENIMAVRSHGGEWRAAGAWHFQEVGLLWNVNYDYVISRNHKAKSTNDASVGKQLIYVPKHRGGGTATITWRDFSLTYNHQFTSRRYITSDNNRWLEPFQTADLGLSWSGNRTTHGLEAYVTAVNIWNENYFVMVARPMPLRYFQAGIKLHIFSNF